MSGKNPLSKMLARLAKDLRPGEEFITLAHRNSGVGIIADEREHPDAETVAVRLQNSGKWLSGSVRIIGRAFSAEGDPYHSNMVTIVGIPIASTPPEGQTLSDVWDAAWSGDNTL